MNTPSVVAKRASRSGTVRVRFALAYAGLLAGTGTALVVLVYVYLRFVPGYSTRPITPAEASGGNFATGSSTSVNEPQSTLVSNIILAVLVLATILVAMWIGWLIAGRLLRPLTTINDAVVRVAEGDLDHRIHLANLDDEFANLARAFDSMIDRIQSAVNAQQRFAANASHELHTPLTTNKTLLDVALGDPASTDFVELAKRLRNTNQDNIDTVDALLDLADIGQGSLDAEQIDLNKLVETAVDTSRAKAEARSIAMTTELAAVAINGNPILISRLATNLLQNAVQHNLTGGTIEVRTRADTEHAWIEVENTGKVVSPEAAATLTEPFVRTAGRTASGAHAGRGLGLAIVESIAIAHGGAIVLAPRVGGGLRVTVSILR